MMTMAASPKPSAAIAPPPAMAGQRNGAEGTLMSSPLPSSVVLRGQKSVAIEHQGSIYRLQVTKLGKLILTK